MKFLKKKTAQFSVKRLHINEKNRANIEFTFETVDVWTVQIPHWTKNGTILKK